MDPVIWDWLSFALRWLHVVAVIAWIGSSFYFIAVDLGLRKREGMPDGVHGEEWQVHGGGFYHIQKYMVAPAQMPEHLTWFKWESYGTWLSGFALLGVVYYAGAELMLIDATVMALAPWQAIAISLAGLFLGWLVYDGLCRLFVSNDRLAFALLFVFFIALTWGFTQVFSGRGAYIHAGAVIATIMTANVLMIIIPGQKKVVAALLAGETPDPALGQRAKQRSTHNNYLTLPVIFLMLSVHYPLAFATRWNWLIVALVLVMGVVIRHFFNTMHARRGHPWWTWGVAAACFAAIVWLSTFAPLPVGDEAADAGAQPPARTVAFDDVRDIVVGRCAMCHAAEPGWEGLAGAPKGVAFDTDAEIRRHARDIYLQAVRSTAMPPGNVSYMTHAERRQLAVWYTGQVAAH